MRIGSIGSNRYPAAGAQDALTIVHASPGDLWRAPLANAEDSELEKVYSDLMVVYGHIHHPYVRQLERLTVANTGSVSLSYDGDTRASYLLVDGSNVSVRRVEYDLEGEARYLTDSRLPHPGWLCRMMRTGRFQQPDRAR